MVRSARRSQTEHTHGRPAERRSRQSLTVMQRPMLVAAGVGWFLTRPGCLAASMAGVVTQSMNILGT